MIKLKIALVIMMITLLVSGCSQGSKSSSVNNIESPSSSSPAPVEYEPDPNDPALNTPTAVVLNYFASLEQASIPDVKNYLSKNSLSKLSDEELIAMAKELQTTKHNFRIWTDKTKSDISQVHYMYNLTANDTIEDDIVYLVLENGKWKISLSTPNPNPFDKDSDTDTASRPGKGKVKVE